MAGEEMQPTGEGPAPDPSAARAGWDASAGSPTPAMPTASPNMPNAEHVDAGGAPPQVSQQQQQPQTVPVAVTPLKRGGILGVMDSVADALVGKTRPELGKDPDGNMYVKQHSLTKGEQWMRIAGEGLVGAAAGLKAGRGHGMGAAGLAGVEAGEHLQDKEKQNLNDEISQDDKIMLSNANRQMLRMNLAEATWKASRLSVDADQKDIDFAQKQEDRLVKDAGGTILGTVAHPGDISSVLKINPTLAEDMVNHHLIELVPHVGSDGKVAGFKVIKMPQGYREQMLPGGATFHTFDPVTHQVVEHKASDPMTAGERDDYDAAANLAMMKFKSDTAEQKLKDAETQKNLGDATKIPSEIEANQTRAGLNRAETRKADAEAGQINQTVQPGSPANLAASSGNGAADSELSKWPAPVQAAVLGLVDYATDPATFPTRKMAKGNEMPRETAIGLAHMIDPSFDEKQWSSRKKAITEWSDPTKAGGTLISLNQAIQHLGELRKGIEGLHNSHFWLWNKGVNVVKNAEDNPAIAAFDTPKQGVINEMAAVFKKTSGTDQEIKSWGNTIDRAAGPRNQNESADKMLDLMVGRVDAMHDQYRRAMGRDPDQPFIGPQAAAVLEAMGPAGKRLVERDRAQVRQKPTAPPPQALPTSSDVTIEQPLAPARPRPAAPSAQTHAFSIGAWQRANPNGDPAAAKAEAQKQGLQVVD